MVYRSDNISFERDKPVFDTGYRMFQIYSKEEEMGGAGGMEDEQGAKGSFIGIETRKTIAATWRFLPSIS